MDILAADEVSIVIGKNEERWRELCRQAAVEKDPKRMLELIKEINRLLEEKQARLQREVGLGSQ